MLAYNYYNCSIILNEDTMIKKHTKLLADNENTECLKIHSIEINYYTYNMIVARRDKF